MSNIEQSALAACRDYVHWKAVIKKLSGDIGGHLQLCQMNRPKDPHPLTDSHLAEAYRPDHDEYKTTYMAPDDIVEFLRETCQHCLKAHEAIQERKAARQKLGAAKRWISRIGKVAP